MESEMSFDKEFFVTFGFTILNIVVLFIILRKLLFKPVTKYMDNRTKKIEEGLKMAEEAKEMLQKMQADYDEKLREAKKEGNEVVATYKKMAEKEYNETIAAAKAEAERMIEDTKLQLQAEKERIVMNIKEEITDLVLQTSEKVLKKNIDDETNRKLISDFISNK